MQQWYAEPVRLAASEVPVGLWGPVVGLALLIAAIRLLFGRRRR